jgi:SAM-dependent methyltransferase
MGTDTAGDLPARNWDPLARARAVGYSEDDIASVPPEVILGMGCGNPVALATLAEGEVVLDLGCGGGFDCLLAADRVGPTGRVIGVDASEEVLRIARAAAAKQGRPNVEFRLGTITELPLPDASVDVVISNCVISDVADRGAAFREVARVLRRGGRVMISDLVLTAALPEDLSGIPEVWAGWLAHAPRREEYLEVMSGSGLGEVGIAEERPYSSPGTPPELLGRIASVLVRAVRQD